MIYVVGSGPAGVSAAMALLKKGRSKVTMVDVGMELESEKQELVKQIQNIPFSKLDDSLLEQLKSNSQASIRGISRKLIYGSDFPYYDQDCYIPIKSKNTNFVPSFAKGGLSNVWGAAVLPFIKKDIDGWPISISDLAPNYKAVLSFMNLSADKDNLEKLFPLYTNEYRSLIPSRQARILFAQLKKNEKELKNANIYFGNSRLAVRSYFSNNKNGCCYCGYCLHGCPYELIYNASSTLSKMQENPNFKYIKDIVIQGINENGKDIEIYGENIKNKQKLSFNASKVFLAGGVLSTTKIMLESMRIYDKNLKLYGSQYFLIPLYNFLKQVNVHEENLHTLSQLFFEILDKNICKNTIHLQLYTYNDYYLEVFKKMLGKFYTPFSFPVKSLIQRILILQGYLHSDYSQIAYVSLSKGKKNEASKINLYAKEDPDVKKIISEVLKKLFNNRKYLNFMPITLLSKIGKFGEGYHVGGTFPMKNNPTNFETDIYGRPHGFNRVHIVDSTVFPSLPATTITLTVMANAYRIAKDLEID